MVEIIPLATLRRSVGMARRFCEASLTCVLLGLLPAAPARAATTTVGDIEITPEPPSKGISSHGYFEYVFLVVNTSKERAHTVSLSIPFERRFTIGDTIRELRRTVQVGPNETVHVSLLQPDHPPLGGENVAVAIDGRRVEREIAFRPSESVRRSLSFYGRGRFSSALAAPVEPLILLGSGVKPLPTTDRVPGRMMGGPPTGGVALPMPTAPGFAPPPPLKGRPPPMAPAVMPRKPPLHPRPRPPSLETLEKLLLPPLAWNGPSCLGALSQLSLAWQMGEIEAPPGKPGLPRRGLQFVSEEIRSDNWLAYCRYDGIIVTAGELDAMPAATRSALWQYVETGGALLVLGRTDLRGLSAVTSRKQDRGWSIVGAGFGICRVCPDANYAAWGADRFDSLMEDWRNTSGVWSSSQRNTVDANREFPIIEDLGVPIRGLFVLMSLFVLGIGPLNLFVLSRLKRRIWLLWTTPILSLCTCLAVFGYMLVSEGWSGRLRSETLTLLDETTHRATTIGWTGVYAPLAPADGLHFRYETEVIPQRYFEGDTAEGRSSTIDWSQDQHFADGWVEARVPALFKVRKSELRRERVSLQREPDGRWSMVNGLGAAVRRFWYADAKGQIHAAEDIPAGARVLLTQTEKETPNSPPNVQNTLSSPKWMDRMKNFAEQPQHNLGPGYYLAEMDDSPFLETALRNARTRRLHALVVGFGKQGD